MKGEQYVQLDIHTDDTRTKRMKTEINEFLACEFQHWFHEEFVL